jgi:hypothetical protein
VKLSEVTRSRIRMALWIAGIAWAVYWFLLGLVSMPSVLEICRLVQDRLGVWKGWFPVGILMVGYVLVLITVVVIFFWFITRLFRKKASSPK